MRRLFLFFGGLSWGGRLQQLAVAIILGWWAWFDFQTGRWPVTIFIVLVAWLTGWILKPAMVAHPRRTSRLLSLFGFVVLAFYVLAWKQWWWRIVLAHYVRELVLWMDLSCSYWFISELRLRNEQAADPFDSSPNSSEDGANGDRFGVNDADYGDDRAYSARSRNENEIGS